MTTPPSHSESAPVLYLHGFASGPTSTKAVYLQSRCAEIGIVLGIPDLNQPAFQTLTLSRQIATGRAWILEHTLPHQPVTIIGSSMGALVATWIAQQLPQVNQLILLAPAFGFLDHWLSRLSPEALSDWQAQGYKPIFHYGYQQEIPLDYQFVSDAQQYPDQHLTRQVPTMILHGEHDEVIPLAASQAYAAQRPWATLVTLNSDHALGTVLPELWAAIEPRLRTTLYL